MDKVTAHAPRKQNKSNVAALAGGQSAAPENCVGGESSSFSFEHYSHPLRHDYGGEATGEGGHVLAELGDLGPVVAVKGLLEVLELLPRGFGVHLLRDLHRAVEEVRDLLEILLQEPPRGQGRGAHADAPGDQRARVP